jgi:predicted DNA-binding protein with PD1-like motif
MKYDNLSKPKCFCIRLEKGEEVVNTLTKFCEQHKISSGSFSGIGATDNLTIGCFDLKNKTYVNKTLNEPLEILSLIGNVSFVANKPFVHAHIIVGKEDCSTIGGHLMVCFVSLTCEIYLYAHKQKINRVKNEELGISILDLKK